MTDNQQKEENKSPSLKAVTMSVLAAMFGVQSDKNRERDFQQGNAIHYIIGGIVFVVLFVVSIAGLVNLIIN